MFERKFGIEIEQTGITRDKAAKVVAEYLRGTIEKTHDHYDTHRITASDGRVWRVMSDGSISCQRRKNGQIERATGAYSVELVSPILSYREDIETLQEVIRRLRKAGSFANQSTGIHIHCSNENHTVTSLRNFVNIIASRGDLLYKALRVEPGRMNYCKRFDSELVEKINKAKPKTMAEFADIWYSQAPSSARTTKYNSTRYSMLNLHSFFNGTGTLELRMFNSGDQNGNLHAGLIRSYIVLALALNNQALTQKTASSRKPQVENERFSMRTWLTRIGLIGDEYKNCRTHLTEALSGDAAWRYGRPARR